MDDANMTALFISELVKAANELHRVSDVERRRLLERAALMIREMRGVVGIPESGSSKDALLNLQAIALGITLGHTSDTQVAAALLDAAGMIRDLYIVQDTKVGIVLSGFDNNN